MMNESVSTIMTKDVISVQPEDSLDKVLEIFKSKRIHHLPVTDHGHLMGLITTSDLMWLNKPFNEYTDIKAKDVMTSKLATLEPDDKVGSAAQIFLKNWFHALPVVERDKVLVGIITSFDVLQYTYNKEYPNDPVTL